VTTRSPAPDTASEWFGCANRLPDLRGGKPSVTSAPCSAELKQIVESLVARAEALRTGRVDQRGSPLFSVE
jgi:hypothetical protein